MVGKKVLVLLVALTLAIFPIFSSDGFLFPSGEPVYRDMENLFLLEGRTGLHSSRPWSQSEVKTMLSMLDKAKLDGISLELYERIESELRYEDYLTFSLELAPEIYTHTNTRNFITPEKWAYGFRERSPFLLASAEAGIGAFSTSTELSYGWGYVTHDDEFEEYSGGVGAIVPEGETIPRLVKSDVYSKAFQTSFPDITKLYLQTPARCNISLGFDKFLLSFMKDDYSWGRSHIGNFIFDSHVNEKNVLAARFWNRSFGFDYALYLPEVDYTSTNNNVYDGKTRIMMAHMLSWNILSNLSLSISENIMWNFNVPELTYFNPSFIFHNLNNSKVLNAIAHLELEYVPVPKLRLYTQFVLDQATAPTESDVQAPAWGISVSADFVTPIDEESLLGTYMEFAYTTPFLYRRENVDFLVFQRHATNVTYRKYPVFTYLGFPYGGDTIAIKAGTSYEHMMGLRTTFDALVAMKGGTDIFTPHSGSGNTHYPDIILSTPSEGGYVAWCLSSDTRYTHSFSWLDMESFINLALLGIDKDLDFQVSAGVKFTI